MIGLRDLASAACRDDRRRAVVLAHPTVNGIDFVEYEHRPADPNPHVLVVAFVKPLPDPPNSDPDGAYGLTTNLDVVRVLGGTRIVNLRVLDVAVVGDRLEIAVDQAGDFSTYWLLLGWQRQADGRWLHVLPALDRQLSVAPLTFKAGCPSPFDCRHEPPCPTEPLDEPVLDYLAKDYASFRRLLLDLIPQRNPGWIERNPADLGMALVELLAYVGDHLSYFQDAVANEMYLDTARHRVSAKRHARLIDYRMHDGRNAWGFVHLDVNTPGHRAGPDAALDPDQPSVARPDGPARPAPGARRPPVRRRPGPPRRDGLRVGAAGHGRSAQQPGLAPHLGQPRLLPAARRDERLPLRPAAGRRRERRGRRSGRRSPSATTCCSKRCSARPPASPPTPTRPTARSCGSSPSRS